MLWRFEAGLAGGSAPRGIFTLSGGKLEPVALAGQPVPVLPGRTLGGLGNGVVNSSGNIAFDSVLQGGDTRLEAIFIKSGQELRKVVDTDTPVPGAPGQKFFVFRGVQFNDTGDIAFGADFGPVVSGISPVTSGIFLMSGGNLSAVVLSGRPLADTNQTFDSAANGWFSLNNRGDIVFASLDGGGVFLFSDGSIKTVAIAGQPVPNSILVLGHMRQPWINDDRDIVFVNQTVVGRGLFPNGIVRWRAGALEKIAAAGEPVPGIAGASFDTDFSLPQINGFGILFRSRMLIDKFRGVPDAGPIGMINTFRDGRLTVVAREDQFIEGIGKLDFIGFPNFDAHGKLLTFVANMNAGSLAGIYAVLPGQFTLFFPQIADGGGTGGSWRTTFILANRSTAAASATVKFYDDGGRPANVAIGGQQQSQFLVSIPALGVARFQTDGEGPLKAGWAIVQGDQNLSGIALFAFSDDSGNFAGEVGAPAIVPFRSMSVFVQAGPGTSTGVALANPNRVPADVDLILRDSNYNEVARTSLTIPVNGHIAKYMPELFPQVALGEFEGKIDVVSAQPLVALSLRQREAVFISLPVIP